MLKTLKIELTQEESKFKDKLLLRSVLSKWMPAADTLIEMMITHLPSPKTA